MALFRGPMSRCSPLVALGLIILNIPALFILMNSYEAQDKLLLWFRSAPRHAEQEKKPDQSQFPATVSMTWTSTLGEVSTSTITKTVTSPPHTVTSLVAVKPPGPSFCDSCGPEDHLCLLYGEHNLARSRVYEGANARFRRVIANAQEGRPTKIGILGGSVTKGHGLKHPHVDNWTIRFLESWKALFPNSPTTMVNGAVAATGSDYYSMCFGQHIDEDVDLVIVELLINDQRIERNAVSYEWLIRGLLALPHNPAILNLHAIGLMFEMITTGGDLHTPVSEYYDSPVISLRNMLVSQILERAELEEHYFKSDKDGNIDLRHVNIRGHNAMADLLTAYTQRQICAVERAKSMRTSPSDSPFPGTTSLEIIPRLRLFQKYDRETVVGPLTPMCQSIRTNKYPLSPIYSEGWREWTYGDNREKPYLIATEPGATVKFEITASVLGRVRITHLRSKTFGLGDLWCWLDDKKKDGKRVVSWWEHDKYNTAVVTTIAENASSGQHVLSCEVMRETSDPGGGHEFRLIAVDAA